MTTTNHPAEPIEEKHLHELDPTDPANELGELYCSTCGDLIRCAWCGLPLGQNELCYDTAADPRSSFFSAHSSCASQDVEGRYAVRCVGEVRHLARFSTLARAEVEALDLSLWNTGAAFEVVDLRPEEG